MKDYVDLVLKYAKKPIDIEKIYTKVEACIQKENEEYVLSSEDKEEINKIIEKGVKRLDYYQTPSDKYIPLFKTSFRKGRFHGNRAGEGFVIVTISYIDKEGNKVVKEEKYSIVKDNCSNAVDGDYVLIDIGGNGQKPKIERILDRNLGNIIGEVIRVGNTFYVKPIDKKKAKLNILLEEEAIEGEIVSVSLEEMRSNNFYVGKILRVFKHKDDPKADALLEAFKSGMPEGFSKESLEQLKSIPNEVSKDEYQGRYDFTGWEIFSIDGADTKDKDDCVSFKMLGNGNYLLGVHIADVAYYVPKGSPIDKDAFRKGTSYYFGGCVEPQLPRKLSNGICSLNDGVDRLTKSILMEFDRNGNLISRSLVRGVIRSRIGMTYDKVNDILNKGIVDTEYIPYMYTLKAMHEFAKTLRENRMANGAINFDRPELKFKYDEEGRAIDVEYRNQNSAESLIEEFMLAANVNVIEMLVQNNITGIFRVHGLPSEERLTDFLDFLKAIGEEFPYSASEILEDKELMILLTGYVKTKGRLSNMLNTNLIRCMSHASYDPINYGHYGTGFDTYCHFTSPIRRLADLGISRIIDECYLEEDEDKRIANIRKWDEAALDYATQASKMERVEEEVEKNVALLDTSVYMSQFIGQEFEGTVICVSNNGLTIQLDNLLEGRVRTRNLEGSYAYNSDTYTLLSLEGNDNYYVGDRLRLRLLNADKEQKSVDFEVIEKIKENRIKSDEESNNKVKSKARDDKFKKTFKS